MFYHADAHYATTVMLDCYTGGIRCFEFTNRGPDALAVFKVLRQQARQHCPGLALGIGTVFTAAEADAFLSAGADFVVQPVTTEAVGQRCHEARVPWLPGALTPGEVWHASQLGAAVVKLFPGSAVSPDYVRALRGPLPQPHLMVTGGISAEAHHIRPWLQAGVLAVGIGGRLLDPNPAGANLSENIARLLAQLTNSNL